MAASSYDEAIRRVLKHEGGYVNDPADPGGPTNYGITLATYRANGFPKATAADVRSMPIAHAMAIYRPRYWNPLGDSLPAGVDYVWFDYAVNSGPARATRVLRAVCGVPAGAPVAELLAAVRTRHPERLVGAICDERLRFLKGLRHWPRFGNGWQRRVDECRAAGRRMAGHQSPANVPSTEAPGKGEVTPNRKAEGGTAGVTVITGTGGATLWGLSPGKVLMVLGATLALSFALVMFMRWRAAKRQETPLVVAPVDIEA